MRKVVIAPTGGGFDTGITANGLYESHIVLAVALGLEKALKDAGASVMLTRSTDAPAGRATTKQSILDAEVAYSNNASADLFLKLTANSETPGACATVFTDSPVQSLALELVHALGQLGTSDPDVTMGTTYVLQHTNAPAIILHLGDLQDAANAQAIHDALDSIAGWIAPVLIKWANEVETAPNYAVDYKPAETQPASVESPVTATIQRWSNLLGVPDWITLSIAKVESALHPDAKGDNGTSFGLFQLHQGGGQGDGYTEAQLLDPDLNCHIGISHMVTAYKDSVSRGLTDYAQLSYVACHSGHPDETGFMPVSYDSALKIAYEQLTGKPANPPIQAALAPAAGASTLPQYAIDAIEFVSAQGWMTKDASGDFRPNDPIDRWQLTVILERFYKSIKG